MHKSATKCNETIGKWYKNKHGASKIIDTFATYQWSGERWSGGGDESKRVREKNEGRECGGRGGVPRLPSLPMRWAALRGRTQSGWVEKLDLSFSTQPGWDPFSGRGGQCPVGLTRPNKPQNFEKSGVRWNNLSPAGLPNTPLMTPCKGLAFFWFFLNWLWLIWGSLPSKSAGACAKFKR
jgi:hypothetical protein